MKKIDTFLDFIAGIILIIFSVIAFITMSIMSGFVLIFFGLSLIAGSSVIRNLAVFKGGKAKLEASPVEDYNIKIKGILNKINIFDIISLVLGLTALVLLIIMLVA